MSVIQYNLAANYVTSRLFWSRFLIMFSLFSIYSASFNVLFLSTSDQFPLPFFRIIFLCIRPLPSSLQLFILSGYLPVGLCVRLSACFCHTLRRFLIFTQAHISANLCCTAKLAKYKLLHLNALINCGF